MAKKKSSKPIAVPGRPAPARADASEQSDVDQQWYEIRARRMAWDAVTVLSTPPCRNYTVQSAVEWFSRLSNSAAAGKTWEAVYCAIRLAEDGERVRHSEEFRAFLERQKRVSRKSEADAKRKTTSRSRAERARTIYRDVQEEHPCKGKMVWYRETAKRLSDELSRAAGQFIVIKLSTIRGYISATV